MTYRNSIQRLARALRRGAVEIMFGRNREAGALAFSIAAYGGVGCAGAATALLHLRFGGWGGGFGEIISFLAVWALTTAVLARGLRDAFGVR